MTTSHSLPHLRTTIATPDAPAPAGAYAQGVTYGSLLFLAGQGPLAPDGRIVAEDLPQQLALCLANLEAVAQAAGTSLRNALRIGVYLDPGVDMAEYNRAFAEHFADEPQPVRTTIFSPFPDFDVEVDAIVALPAG
jgi:2-iminobutanoate/2-iminopropanoate deaminase